MSERIVPACVVFAAFSLACIPGSDPSAESAETMADEDTEADTDEADTGEAETGDAGPNLGICEQYIECVEAATPEILATTKAVYGSEGACWDLAGVSESDCHTECRALLHATMESHPGVEECFECVEDADCTSGTPYCHNDEGLCQDEPQILSCDFWEPVGFCREFGEVFTHEEKRIWCAAIALPLVDLLPDGYESERSTACKLEGSVGHCDWYVEGDAFEDLAPGPVSTYYYDDHPEYSTSAAESEEYCVNELGGTWVPL